MGSRTWLLTGARRPDSVRPRPYFRRNRWSDATWKLTDVGKRREIGGASPTASERLPWQVTPLKLRIRGLRPVDRLLVLVAAQLAVLVAIELAESGGDQRLLASLVFAYGSVAVPVESRKVWQRGVGVGIFGEHGHGDQQSGERRSLDSSVHV